MSLALAAKNPSVVHHQRIIILNKNGEKLVGILHETGTTTGIVILCHGVQCSKDTELIVNLAVALEKAQISSFRFDFSGCGESEGTYTRDNFWEEVDDLRAVAQHFRESNRVIHAIVGHSKESLQFMVLATNRTPFKMHTSSIKSYQTTIYISLKELIIDTIIIKRS